MGKCPLRLVAGLTLLAILIASCGGGGRAPTSTPVAEPTIDPTYTTYADEDAGFRLSYPSHWVLALSALPEIAKEAERRIKDAAPDVPFQAATILFFAQDPSGFPNVNVVVQKIPEVSPGEYVEAMIYSIRKVAPDTKIISQVAARVGGKKGHITEYRSVVPDSSQRRFALFTLPIGRQGWAVTCAMDASPATEVIETCNRVVRTLRVVR